MHAAISRSNVRRIGARTDQRHARPDSIRKQESRLTREQRIAREEASRERSRAMLARLMAIEP